jgi:hypothetical protein
MGVFCLARRLVCYFIYVYFPDIFRHRIDFFFKTGPKKAILRTNAHECARGNTKSRVEMPFYPHITGVFASFLRFAFLPSIYTPSERDVLVHLDYGPWSKIQRGENRIALARNIAQPTTHTISIFIQFLCKNFLILCGFVDSLGDSRLDGPVGLATEHASGLGA